MDAWALVKKPSFISDKSLVGRRPTHLILRLTILAAATLAILSCKPDNQINVTSTPPESDEDSNSPEVFLTIIDNIGRYSLVRQEDFVSLLWASSQPVEVSLDYSSDGVVWNEFAVVPAGTSDYTFRGLDSSIPNGYLSFRLRYGTHSLDLGSIGMDSLPPQYWLLGSSSITGCDNAPIPFTISTARDNLDAWFTIYFMVALYPVRGNLACDAEFTPGGNAVDCIYYPLDIGTNYTDLFMYYYLDSVNNSTAQTSVPINITHCGG